MSSSINNSYNDFSEGARDTLHASSQCDRAGLMSMLSYGQDGAGSLFTGQAFSRVTPFAVVTADAPFETIVNGTKWDRTELRAHLGNLRGIDLIGPCFLHMQLGRLDVAGAVNPASTHVAWVNDVGHAAIELVRTTVAGIKLQETDRLMLHNYSELGLRGANIDTKQLRGHFDEAPGRQLIPFTDSHRIFACADRHIYTDLQLPFGTDRGSYLPICAISKHAVDVNITLAPWIDLVRARDFTPPEKDLTDAEISAMNPGGAMKWCALTYVGIILSVVDRARFTRTPSSYMFKYTKREISPLNVKANDVASGDVKIDGMGPTVQRLFFYQRNAAIGNGTPKQYFDFSTGIMENDIPTTLSNTVYPQIHWPISPFESMSMSSNGKVFISGPGEMHHLLAPYLAKQHQIPTTFVHTINHELETSTTNTQPKGVINDSGIDNLVANFTYRKTNLPKTGIAEDGKLHIYSQRWNAFSIKDGMVKILSTTV